jgi:hypothetical protein
MSNIQADYEKSKSYKCCKKYADYKSIYMGFRPEGWDHIPSGCVLRETRGFPELWYNTNIRPNSKRIQQYGIGSNAINGCEMKKIETLKRQITKDTETLNSRKAQDSEKLKRQITEDSEILDSQKAQDSELLESVKTALARQIKEDSDKLASVKANDSEKLERQLKKYTDSEVILRDQILEDKIKLEKKTSELEKLKEIVNKLNTETNKDTRNNHFSRREKLNKSSHQPVVAINVIICLGILATCIYGLLKINNKK